MLQLDKQQILSNISKPLDDEIYSKIERYYPVAKICPTCDGALQYTLFGVSFPCDCKFQKMLQKSYFAANIGREYHDICLEHFISSDRKIVVDVVEKYLEDYKSNFHYGLAVTFSGTYGTGKTFAMCCILKDLIKQGEQCYFVTFDDLIEVWGSSYHDDVSKKLLQDKLKSVDFLGLDEVKTDGRNKGGFLSDGLDHVIRHRTSNLLPTFMTTNMTPEQEENEFGKAFSLLSARNQRVHLLGKDVRRDEIRVTNRLLKDNGDRRPVC